MTDAGAQLITRSLAGLFAYVSNRIPEISDTIYSIDDALKAGFAWDLGPFEYWDAIGLEKGIELAEKDGQNVAEWVKEMIANGHSSFYITQNGLKVYNPATKAYIPIPGRESLVNLTASSTPLVYKNADAALHDIGDGVEEAVRFTNDSLPGLSLIHILSDSKCCLSRITQFSVH